MTDIEIKINEELNKLRAHIDKINNSAVVYAKAESISNEIIAKQQKTDVAVQEITESVQVISQFIEKLVSHYSTSQSSANKLTGIENKLIDIQNVVDIQKSKLKELENKLIAELQKTKNSSEALLEKQTYIEEGIEDLKKELNFGRAFQVILIILIIFNILFLASLII